MVKQFREDRLRVEILLSGFKGKGVNPKVEKFIKENSEKKLCNRRCTECEGAQKWKKELVQVCFCNPVLGVGFLCNKCGECMGK